MKEDTIKVGDLVVVKDKLQKIVALREWGIVISETLIIAADISDDEDFEPIESFIIFFPADDDTLTIPKNCLKKIVVIEE